MLTRCTVTFLISVHLLPQSHFQKLLEDVWTSGFCWCFSIWQIFPYIFHPYVEWADNPPVTGGWSEDVERVFEAGMVQSLARLWNIACRSLADVWTILRKGNKYPPGIPQISSGAWKDTLLSPFRHPPVSWSGKICQWRKDIQGCLEGDFQVYKRCVKGLS